MSAIAFEANSTIVESGACSDQVVPTGRYVKTIEADGTIRLIPLELLHESELAVLENHDLYVETRQGLADFAAGKRVSSDWLFADE